MKVHGLLLGAFLLLAGVTFGQTDAAKAKTISGGVLNGKAVSLPKPSYPPAARAVNAEGAVSVQVLIDEEGSVVSANAVSGHPLLRPAATAAAQGAKFSPTLLMGQPVKVSGVITYNFIGTTTNAAFGYEIAFAERSGSFTDHVFPRSLAARMPEEWAVERTLLEGLTFEGSEAPAVKVEKAPVAAPVSGGVHIYTVKGDSAEVYRTGKLTASSLESLRQLHQNVRAKLAADQKNEWHFRVGMALGVFAAEINDADKASFNIAELEQLAANSPQGIPQNVIAALQKLIELARTSDGSPEAKAMLVRGAQGIKNLRI